ncbi:MAG: hypothetical protein DME03_23620 [Candidatus Rokuibacteriota bacterium]|nr:MAG: hypothetical protein DME03_23620 [Candidatus Rokubacteria bacterium]
MARGGRQSPRGQSVGDAPGPTGCARDDDGGIGGNSHDLERRRDPGLARSRARGRLPRGLRLGCGPGNFTCALAEAGFNVTGLDSYAPLVGSAKGKRRARHLANLTFRQGDLTRGNTFRDGAFDQVVSIHALYAHPTPDRLLREAYRVLKPGGHAVFVNHTRRIGQWPTLREIARRDGLAAALQGLLWVLLDSIFEATRERVGPHYWDEATFSARLGQAGFAVLDMRRTFLGGASLLVWARKSVES